MKNLANCKPSEFLKQTSRIRKAVDKLLTATDIMNIRKNVPTLAKITPDMDDDAREKVLADNKKLLAEQSQKNLTRMLDAILDEHPDETLELLSLLCFVEPKNVDDHPVEEYLTALTEMITNEAVIGFFTSLAQLGLMNTSDASRA